ncbi:MAG: hypothetical protein AB7N80_06110 [Bdellovibrionales bacterium]
MLGKFTRNFLAVVLLLSATLAAAEVRKKGDLLPWPWGSECPFPWTKIEGEWTSRQKNNPDRFTFEVKGTWDNGTRVLEIRRYNEKDELIGLGEGTSQRREKIVRASMAGVGPAEGESYWAIIRTYVEEEQKRSCSKNRQVTVITLRDANGSEENDVHLIIDKDDASRKTKP